MQHAFKCLQELFCREKVLVKCQLLPVLPVSFYSACLDARRCLMVQKAVVFHYTSCTPCGAAPAASIHLKKQQGTASPIHPGVPLAPFSGSLSECVSKNEAELVYQTTCVAVLVVSDCVSSLSSLPAEASQSHMVTEEAGSWYERWSRNWENVVISMVFSCIGSIPSCCASPLCLSLPHYSTWHLCQDEMGILEASNGKCI